jgi:hypothetical protein
VPFSASGGVSIQQKVDQCFQEIQVEPNKVELAIDQSNIDDKHAALRSHWLGWTVFELDSPAVELPPRKPEVVAMGPVGFVYMQKNTSAEVRHKLALRISNQQKGLLVCLPVRDRQNGQVLAIVNGETHRLPKDSELIFGADHPFFPDIANDFIGLVNHDDSGDIVLVGWSRLLEKPMSLRTENGSHAGPGEIETHAFALLPSGIELGHPQKPYARPNDLRCAALKVVSKTRSTSAS